MPRGGARIRSGPPADPRALRRLRKDDDATWTWLPAEGRSGRVPAWPLLGTPNRQQLAAWRRLWKTPQAVQWELDRMHERVARYICKQLEADEPGASAARINAAIRLADDIGLTYGGMNRLRWRIAPDQLAIRRAEKKAEETGTQRKSARSRMKVLDGGRGRRS